MIDLGDTHHECAKKLYAQFLLLRREEWVEQARLLDLESRIRGHLYGIASCDLNEDIEPESPEAVFVMLAACLLHGTSEVRHNARSLAFRWLSDADVERRNVARHILILFPLEDSKKALHGVYMDYPESRAEVVRIWSQLGYSIPAGLLNQGELQLGDVELQTETMRFLAHSPDGSKDVFLSYYLPLVANPVAEVDNPGVLEYAILGGLIRGDRDARIALRRTLERSWDDEEVSIQFLRLAAILGDPEFYPVIDAASRERRTVVTHLLALHGDPRALETLVELMEDPGMASSAARAWYFISGKRITEIPRMALVDKVGNAVPPEGMEEMIPDRDEAISWLAKNSSLLSSQQRLLFGKPVTSSSLVEQILTWGGRTGNDLCDILAIQRGEPLGLAHEGWILDLKKRMEEIRKTMEPDITLGEPGTAGVVANA